MDKTDQLKQIIDQSKYLVFFGGAGVSTASGIPDFRSATGLYNQRTGSKYPLEVMLSYSFFKKHPSEFFDYHLQNLIARDARPNPAHLALAELEKRGILKAVITQNIDRLHQQAGSINVIELHGNTFEFYCEHCRAPYNLAYVDASQGIPRCQKCGGMVRPNVVLYEEALDPTVLEDAEYEIRKADTLLIGGTSLVVYPAAGLLQFFHGRNLVMINRDPTPMDSLATLLVHGDIAEILSKAVFG